MDYIGDQHQVFDKPVNAEEYRIKVREWHAGYKINSIQIQLRRVCLNQW